MYALMGLLLISCSNNSSNFQIAKEPDKVLFVVSNASFYGSSGINTANHFAEIVFAYDVLDKAGYAVDFVSPKGGLVPIGYIYSDTLLQKYLYDEAFMDLLQYTYRPEEIDANAYTAIFYAGGGSAMFGVPENIEIQEIARAIYDTPKGIVSAVCHGTAGIANLKTLDGSFIVSNKRVNGFPDLFENKNGKYYEEFPFSIEEAVTANGGIFSYSEEGWDGYLEVDGKLITGQDPTSSSLVASAIIETLKSKPLNQQN